MEIRLKPLQEQVMVITGGSSGIGLATARLAVREGARVVIAARSKPALKRAVKQLRKEGGEVVPVVADVADERQVGRIAETALRAFGGFDTWVNNAGSSIFGRLEEVAIEDARRLFETNYWGVVNGSLVAAEHLREHGGAIINVGSVLSELSIPLQGHYSASKHAVKGFTDALRVELEEEDAPISVTLVKPSSIDTPLPHHARNYLEVEPTLPPPLYSPRVVARAILRCAEHPEREVTVGGGGRVLSVLGGLAPRLVDRYFEVMMPRQQRTDEPVSGKRRDSLHRPRKQDSREEGDYTGHVMRSSLYTGSVLHPVQTALAATLLGTGIFLALRGARPPVD